MAERGDLALTQLGGNGLRYPVLPQSGPARWWRAQQQLRLGKELLDRLGVEYREPMARLTSFPAAVAVDVAVVGTATSAGGLWAAGRAALPYECGDRPGAVGA
jgi:hypothetical protein